MALILRCERCGIRVFDFQLKVFMCPDCNIFYHLCDVCLKAAECEVVECVMGPFVEQPE
jgi:hypothetical protein